MRKQQLQHQSLKPDKNDDQFDDAPPVLVPEENPEEVVIDNELHRQDLFDEAAYALGDHYFVNNGVLYTKRDVDYSQSASAHQPPYHNQQSTSSAAITSSNNELSLADPCNICCGICGEIVPYELLADEHLPLFHPEVLNNGVVDLEEIPYEAWLNEKLQVDSKVGILPGAAVSGGVRYMELPGVARPLRSTRTLRRISQIRVNINEMTLEELDIALNKKMVEKMGRKVPVTLVDKQHARCGICGSVVSLNKKFEVVHLVRHFNAWHPSAHKCAGIWLPRGKTPAMPPLEGTGNPLSTQDFAVIDTSIDAAESLQCIWCGMFMDGKALAMHFHEVHPDEIEVPKCNLCLQEIVINARFTEKYGEDFNITLPDEHHLRCGKFDTKYRSENALDKAIARHVTNSVGVDEEDEDEIGNPSERKTANGVSKGCEAFSNSRMTFGRRSKPKRQFIQPALRQAVPVNSLYVEQVADCHWRCRICRSDILAAVISAGAIRHYRHYHPNQLQSMQFELCKARLERVSDGCMEFLNVETIECLICNMTFPLHRPFNMCRAIRHLKAKHPEKMPEYNGGQEVMEVSKIRKQKYDDSGDAVPSGQDMADHVMYAKEIVDFAELEMLHQQYNVDFDKVYEISGKNLYQPIYVLTNDGEEINEESVRKIVSQLGGAVIEDNGPIVVQYSKCESNENDPLYEDGQHHPDDELPTQYVDDDGALVDELTGDVIAGDEIVETRDDVDDGGVAGEDLLTELVPEDEKELTAFVEPKKNEPADMVL